MDASQNIPENRQGDLDMLRSMAGSVGSDSTLSEQLAAVNQPSGSHPVLSAMLSRPGPAGSAVEAGVSSGSGQRNPFHVDTAQLRAVPLSQQEAELQDLGLTVYNQQEFETGTSGINTMLKCFLKKSPVSESAHRLPCFSKNSKLGQAVPTSSTWCPPKCTRSTDWTDWCFCSENQSLQNFVCIA